MLDSDCTLNVREQEEQPEESRVSPKLVACASRTESTFSEREKAS